MEGYEFFLQLPDFSKREERKYKFLLDTPGSSIDRKLSIDLIAKRPNTESTSISLKTYSPFYTLDADIDMQNQPTNFRLKADAVGNKKRRYSLLMDVAKDVRGARLIEYQPKISLVLPYVRPIEMAGTVVFSKGRKDQVTINMESSSFESPLTLKGNLLKEGGDLINLDADWKLMSEINISAFSQIHRIQHVLGNEAGKGIYLNLKRHYEPDGRSYESVTLEAKVENIEFRDRLQFSLENKILLAEHQDLNSLLRWDFSFKPFAHYRNDIEFRYGENFEDDRHVVRLTHIFALNGDFETYQKMDIENKLGLTISCFDFDKSVALSAVWDFVDSPKLFIEAGVKSEMNKEISVKYDYRHITDTPLKMASKGKFVYNDYKFLYNNQLDETGTNEYKGNAIIEPRQGKQITVDYVYKVKSQDHFHHEFDGVANFPGNPDPMKLKADLTITDDSVKLNSIADSGVGSPYSVDMNLQRNGPSDVALKLPQVEGTVNVNSQNGKHTIKADVQTLGRRVVVSGDVAEGTVDTLNFEVLWDADRDSQKKITIEASSNKGTENGIDNYAIKANIKYEGAINVDVVGKISNNIIRGPHSIRADFSGNMEPMAIDYMYEIQDGRLVSVAKYLRSNSEKMRLDTTGQYIFTGSKFEIEYKMLLSSPYKSFDGKELYFQIMADSTDTSRVFVTEYRIRPAPVIGYNGKLDYHRKRGFPGQIRSNLLVTVHQRPIYEGFTHIDYGNGKYSWKSSFTPISKRKINLLTSFEHSAGFAAFHHSMAASLRYLQKVELNAVADLRTIENATVHSNLNINEHKLYDANSTLKVRSIVDFDGQLVIWSKITPALHLFYKGQPSGQLTKFDLNLDVDSVNLMTGSGELKKRKKGFNGDIVFKYKEKEFLALTINQEAKSKNERNYLIKAKCPWRSYTLSVKVNKEKKGSVKYDTKFCRNDDEMCIAIDAHHKESGDMEEWDIFYKRGDMEFNIERIRVSTNDMSRFHTVIFHGDKRFGYDLRLAREDNGHSVSLGLILPSREIVMKTYAEVSLRKPRIKFEFQADARKNPDRKMVTDVRFENHLTDNTPSKLNIIITHPIYEKPIDLQVIGDYQPDSNTYLTAEMSADYSTDLEDKLIGKLSVDRDDTAHTFNLKTYHKVVDEQHLDVHLKTLVSNSAEETVSGVYWTWKDEGDEEKKAFTEYRYNNNDRKFAFEFNRPQFVYKLEGAEASPHTLLGAVVEIDLLSTYKGETTKAKLFANFDKNCYELHVLNDAGEKIRTFEVCFLGNDRKLFSLVIEGLDDEGNWVFDGAVQMWQKTWRTVNFRAHFNEEFLGQAVFKFTSFGEELSSSHAGGLPFARSPRFKKVMASVISKLWQPSMRFFLPEAIRFYGDIKRDSVFLSSKLAQYYERLPPMTQVKESVQKIRLAVRAALREVWDIVKDFYKEYFKTAITVVEKATGFVTAVCNNNEDCRGFVNAFNERGWTGICDQLKVFLQSLPERIRAFMSRPGRDARKFFDQVMTVVKAALQPLTKYRCGEIVVKIVQLTYKKAEPYIQSFLEHYPEYYRNVRQAIVTNPYVIQAAETTKQTYFRVKERVSRIDYRKLYETAKMRVEDYLLNLTPPSIKSSYKINSLKHGEVDIDLHVGVSQSYVGSVVSRVNDVVEVIVRRVLFAASQHGRNSILVNLKRGADMNFFPPYEAQAMIVGNEHFITFDKAFYDFAGECAYLLTRDFEDGNFTFVLKPKEGDKDASILALIKDTKIEISVGESMVKLDDSPVELPLLQQGVVVSRVGDTLFIDDQHGIQVRCNLAHKICAFSISGWYFGKTAGLLGTYNYESYDEFKRPKGQIANTPTVHAKSWELKKGCKSNNLVPDVKINENSDYYKLCKSHFKDKSSPLSACFYEVNPKEYFQLCNRHLSRSSDKNKALCDISAAYVMECERNYIELNLPNKCLTCRAPNGSTLNHGDRKKYENLKQKSADVVFLVEDHSCNRPVLQDLSNLAKSVDRELQNIGLKDSQFGVVGFGGDIGQPQIFTAKGKTLFSARDASDIVSRIKLENTKLEPSRAFEAMKLAVTNSFRSDATKSLVLLSCSPCKFDFKSLLYPVIHQILLERGITLHVVQNAEITIRKKEKDIIGVDPDSVYHSKDFTQVELKGSPSLRPHVHLPKDLCAALSQEVGGSFFSSRLLAKAAAASEVKNWRSVFTRKFAQAVQTFECQYCDCTSTRDHTPHTVCQPCEPKRSRLPFSVCKYCDLPRTVQSFVSYILQIRNN